MKIIIVNGAPRAGKNLFVSYCLEELGVNGEEISTVDFVKDVARYCGWNGEKTGKNRNFLSDLKDLLSNWDDVPFKKVKEKINKILDTFRIYDVSTDKLVIFIYCREPDEIERYKYEYGARSLVVRRDKAEKIDYYNHADSEVLNYDYDYLIGNDGTKEDLKEKAKVFIINLEKENWESNA